MNACPFCLGPTFHSSCAEAFHGTANVPIVSIDAASIESIIGAQVEKIGGVQPKFTADLSDDGTALVPREGGRFIVKPQWPKRKHLPQNEHLSMCLARRVGIDAASCALFPTSDGTNAYVTKRFDRGDGDPPTVYQQLDFCQLLDIPQDQKYDHPASRCVDVISEYSSGVDADLRELFRLFVFCFWIGNGDLHLKNLSLLDRGGLRLSPAYDLACSYVFGDERFALPILGREKDISRPVWLRFAASCRLDESAAARAIDALLSMFGECIDMIRRSALPDAYRPAYVRCMSKRRRALQGDSIPAGSSSD